MTGTGRERISFCEVDIERAATFAAENAEVTLALHQALKPRLLSEHLVTVYETLERPLVSVLAGMERISVDIGQFVLTGEPVGVMGNGPQVASAMLTGATGTSQPVLYIEFRKDGSPVDPNPWWATPESEKVRG